MLEVLVLKKRVVIVEDSTSMRRLIAQSLVKDGRFKIVGEAADPFIARDVIRETRPDVLTLDVEMPRMNGLTFLEKIMRLRPMPVVMLSTETHRGSAAAIEALSLGAIDCIGKPRVGEPQSLDDLAERVFVAASANLPSRGRTSLVPPSESYQWNGRIVLIGASTGGVDALERVLGGMPPNCPPIMVAQHMPEAFLASFAERLSRRVAPAVSLAADGEELRQGQVRLAPGGANHLVLSAGGPRVTCQLLSGDKCNGHRPSVDVLFRSGVCVGPRILPVLLTGMGRDGASGMLELKRAGAATMAQDKESCVVHGMPRVASEMGAVSRSVSLNKIAAAILEDTRIRCSGSDVI